MLSFIFSLLFFHSLYAKYHNEVLNISKTAVIYHKNQISMINIKTRIDIATTKNIFDVMTHMRIIASNGKLKKIIKLITTLILRKNIKK